MAVRAPPHPQAHDDQLQGVGHAHVVVVEVGVAVADLVERHRREDLLEGSQTVRRYIHLPGRQWASPN